MNFLRIYEFLKSENAYRGKICKPYDVSLLKKVCLIIDLKIIGSHSTIYFDRILKKDSGD